MISSSSGHKSAIVRAPFLMRNGMLKMYRFDESMSDMHDRILTART